jgi:hypothetical protein
MLLVHLLAALLVGLLAAALGHRAGFSAGGVVGCYFLGSMVALATSAAIERWAERARACWAEQRAPDDEGR